MGETPVPAMGGSVDGGGNATDAPGSGLVAAVPADLTTAVTADPVEETAPEALACAERWTCSPAVAFACTCTVAWSSSAWPTGRFPTLQVALAEAGQTVNAGEPMWSADATLARTDTAALAALVDHTQITKPALWPALT